MDIQLESILRVGVCGCFVGHGWIAFSGAEASKWRGYLAAGGFTSAEAVILLPLIGLLDIAIGILTLFYPLSLVTIWAAAWAFVTAAIRPIAGESIWAAIERAGNWATPLALVYLHAHRQVSRSALPSWFPPWLADMLDPSLSWDLSLKYVFTLIVALLGCVLVLRTLRSR